MNLLKFFIISGYIFGVAHASVKGLSLNDYLTEVKEENTTIEASKLRALSLKYKIKPGSTFDDPFIAFGLDEIPFDGGRAKIRRYQISQSIPFPGKLSARSEIAETKAVSSEFDAITVERQIQVLATQIFLRASYNKQEIELNQKIQKIIEEITASAKARYRTGDTTHHEWLLAKLELSVLNVDLLRLNRTQKSLTALLNELRNRPSDSQIEVDHEGILETVDENREIRVNLDSQPELQGWLAQKKVSEAELKLAKLSFAPDFVIQGMAMQPTMKDAEMSEPSNWGVMIGMTIPLYFWRKQSDLVAAAEKDRLATMADYQSLQNRLNTEIADAKLQLQTSLDVVKLYKNDVIPITEIAVKNARISYASKALPMRQLLDALRSEKTQELELLAAQMDVVVAKTRMTELLSNPPATRFAPTRPTLFGAAVMDSSGSVNMGSGISVPTQKQNAPGPNESSSGGMGGGM